MKNFPGDIQRMILRRAWLVIPLFCALGCLGSDKGEKAKSGKTKKPNTPTMADQSGDVSFQSFLGRLRAAVKMRDVATLASMMTTNFGYSINPDREGEGVFQYWEQNDIWKELELVLREKFVPHESFMVAPPQFATDPDGFAGYRAGIRTVNGSWRFAYFVSSGAPAPDAKPKP